MDIGGGSGWILNQIRAADSRVQKSVVVDITASAADEARTHGHEFYCVPIEEFHTTEKFDLVLALNLIEHVRTPGEVLKKIASLLSPTGVVLFKTPNYRSFDADVFRHRNWGGYHCPRHWVLYNKASFERATRTAGLEVISAQYTQGAPFWAISVIAWLAKAGFIKVSADLPAYKHKLYQPLLLVSATFDFLRVPFAPTSQMFFQARRAG
jgi:SAM-dependent methyltransferase